MSGRAGAVASGPVGRTRSGLGGGCVSRRGLLSSRSFRLIRVKLERRPSRGGPQAVVSKSHPSGEPEVYEPCHVATCLFDPVSSLWSPQLHWQVQVRDRCLSIRVPAPSFSRLRHVSFRFASFKFSVISSARWPSIESARDGAGRGNATRRGPPGSARNGLAWPACRASELDNVSRASRQCPWRLTGCQSRQAFVCSSAAMAY